MPVRRWLGYVALVCVVAIAGCHDFTGPTSSAQKKPTSPVGASFSRYILISGVWTCVEGCDDNGGPDAKGEELPTTPPDSRQIIPIDLIPLPPIDSTAPPPIDPPVENSGCEKDLETPHRAVK